ncbi:MFS transporter [Streptomyces gobiensis]|uniref:MFS transporter n=1 Tax=Streptomyces gobiensis TaxID=2875706 RepID=UPI001E5F7C3C|nr:MFS transporter [Streptomyces gobiensis]UGY91969.1 MFS transporter [Streptomyces gobiensis]
MTADGRIRAALRHPVSAALLLAVVLHLLWVTLVANDGGDLAAQDAWAEFAGRHPGSAYNLAWYGGMHPVSYSVISPYLMAAIGVRSTLAVAGVLSSGLLAWILARSPLQRPLLPALAGAVAMVCNAASGRVTFALGMLFALGAVAVVWAWPRRWAHWRRSRGTAAFVLAALATAGSPVAGLFLWVVAGALLLARRRQAACALALAPPIVVALSAWLFPFQGVQPMPWDSTVFPVFTALAVFGFAPREWRAVRLSAAIYAAGTVLTWAIPSQVGSNVERMGLMFGAVVLLAVLLERRPDLTARRRAALLLALSVVVGWQFYKPVWDVVKTTPDAAWARELAPLVDRLKQEEAERGRVEVVPARSHREASALAPYVNLARGWNRQADTDRNPLFYDKTLTSESYHAWLQRWAVRFVVLPHDEPDGAGRGEARIVRAGPPYLHKVWSDANWELYRVVDPTPLAEPPAEVERAAAGEVKVTVRDKGRVLVRIPWSPWLGLVDVDGERIAPPGAGQPNEFGCLRSAEPVSAAGADGATDTWTLLEAPGPGTYRIAAPYRLPRGTPCPDG